MNKIKLFYFRFLTWVVLNLTLHIKAGIIKNLSEEGLAKAKEMGMIK